MLNRCLLVSLLCASSLAFLRPLAADTPTAQIPNPSFEAGQKAPGQWAIKGDVSLDESDKVDGARSLRFKRDPVTLPATRAVSEKFKIAPGVWDLTASDKFDLFSPDVSYNVSVGIDFFDAAGKEIKSKKLVIASEKSNWGKFKERFDVPSGTTDASLAIDYNKTHGEFWIDCLALQYVGQSVPMEGGDRKTVFYTNRDGFLFYPGGLRDNGHGAQHARDACGGQVELHVGPDRLLGRAPDRAAKGDARA